MSWGIFLLEAYSLDCGHLNWDQPRDFRPGLKHPNLSLQLLGNYLGQRDVSLELVGLCGGWPSRLVLF